MYTPTCRQLTKTTRHWRGQKWSKMTDVAKCRADIFRHVADMSSDTSMSRQNWRCRHPTNPTKWIGRSPIGRPGLMPSKGGTYDIKGQRVQEFFLRLEEKKVSWEECVKASESKYIYIYIFLSRKRYVLCVNFLMHHFLGLDQKASRCHWKSWLSTRQSTSTYSQSHTLSELRFSA